MVSYDPAVIQQFAESLYRRAQFIIAQGAVGGGIAVAIAIGLASRGSSGGAIFGFVVGAVAGAVWGYGRGFSLRLQAQTALCQKQIEENTRYARIAFEDRSNAA